ncbi:DUF4397 domain-containing protein [Cellulomonas chengniuliangii]|uniref:DUF4397 domain-containing protein n=1 Tax=Cellulomonas chengniuliangii TaxID=2968084 RepID=A0ABY5KV28_9CELL|nr:DUF4397 domain-containing protein [Cellulomonas chengniuliangii]MCC2308873.1 DUF4397 domain-containing protein [Cellulomonas chengniuliangii]UUI74386.1 DUF4397 domain-containing protein [Cellulomonas chengniuliangii]
MRARPFAAAAGTIAVAALTFAAVPAQAATGDNAQLSVLHGVPGLTVDVWVNGERTIDDFTPGSLAGPLDLPAGTYTVAITAADATDASSPAIGPVDLPLDAGGNYTAVAHLDTAGSPTATLFTNDTSPTAAGQGRLTVRHVAAAPAVDVLAAGQPVVTNLTNPNEQSLDLPAGTVSATVVAAGTTEPALLGPADVNVAEGSNTIVYAWGNATSDPSTLALATQVVGGLHSNPSGVQAGQAGLVDDSGTQPWMIAAGVLALLGAGVLTVARRQVAPAKDDR